MTTGIVFDIRKFSIHDGPGIRTTVFLKGCPLQCAWCHNPEGQSAAVELMLRPGRCIRCGACLEACPQGAISLDGDVPVTNPTLCRNCGACVESCYAGARELVGREMGVADVLHEIERDRPFYDESGGGVTVSGGEPLMQPDFLAALLRACREREIHTALDTCGYAPWATVDRVRESVDLFLYDLKIADDDRHRAWTGASNRPILENLRALSRLGHRIILRTPVVPGVNDDEENLRAIARIAAELPRPVRVQLLPYHRIGVEKYSRLARPYTLPEAVPPAPARLEEIAGALQQAYGVEVSVQ